MPTNAPNTPISTGDNPPTEPEPISNFPFVGWLRDVAPYIHSFREKTFVIAFAGELVLEIGLENLIEDIAMLHAMGMRIILVHGIRPQIEEQLMLRNIKSKFGKSTLYSYRPVSLDWILRLHLAEGFPIRQWQDHVYQSFQAIS